MLWRYAYRGKQSSKGNGVSAFIDSNGRIDVFGEDGAIVLVGQADYCLKCGRPFNLRPMTLEEAVAYGRPVWVKWKKPYPVLSEEDMEKPWLASDTPEDESARPRHYAGIR